VSTAVFSACQARVGRGPTDDEAAGRVNEEEARVVEPSLVVERGRKHRDEHVLDDVAANPLLDRLPRTVLRRHEDVVDLDRPRHAVVVCLVADRHERLPVGTEVGEHGVGDQVMVFGAPA